MEEESLEINVAVDGQIACQLFAKEEDTNLTLVDVKEKLLEDVQELIPTNYRFLKPISGNSEIPIASKQEKLITMKKCLVKSNNEHSLHLQSYEEKPSDAGGSNKDASSSKEENEHKEDDKEQERPRKMLKQTTIESAFKLDRKERPADLLNEARGRVHLYSMRDIERASAARKEYYTFWNVKAQELCSDQTFAGYKKQELHGIIDTAWQMKSCEILTAQAEDELQNMPSNKPEKSKTLSKNIKRVQEARRVANELNKQVSGLKRCLNKRGGNVVRSELSQTEGKLKDAMSEIKLAQDALRKSIAKAQ